MDGYSAIRAAWDREFQRNRNLHGSRIQCRSGCSDCCHQLFQITEIEAAEIARGVATLPPERSHALAGRSRQYAERRREITAIGGEPEAWGSLPPPGARLACPALGEDGACTIYEFRPLICRKFGVPLWNPDRPGRVWACELNFRPGEEIEDGELIQIHTGLHQAWKQTQASDNTAGGYRDPEPRTVARAILASLPE